MVLTAPSAVLATAKAKVPTVAQSAILAVTSAKSASGGARPKTKTAPKKPKSSEGSPGAMPFIGSHMHLAISCEQARKTMGKSGQFYSSEESVCEFDSDLYMADIKLYWYTGVFDHSPALTQSINNHLQRSEIDQAATNAMLRDRSIYDRTKI